MPRTEYPRFLVKRLRSISMLLLIVIGLAALQVLGTLYITHTLKGARETYGTFAVVIGLLSWIYLIAQLTMFAAEANVVAARRKWPRSLFTPAATSADEPRVKR